MSKKTETIRYKHHKFQSWQEARITLLELCDRKKTIIFRGQSNSSWDLTTSFERMFPPQKLSYHMENRLINKFEKGIRSYLHNQIIGNSKFEILTLMQHYGAPTRLIDFTKSPYIAAFFAFEEIRKPIQTTTVTIWAVEAGLITLHNRFLYNSIVDITKSTKDGSSRNFVNNETVDKLMASELPGIIPILPPTMDSRMLSQQSVFLMPTTLSQPFHSLFEKYSEIFNGYSFQYGQPITRIDISINERLNVLNELDLMNINHRTLFPGIDGFARSINWEIELYTKRGAFAKELKNSP